MALDQKYLNVATRAESYMEIMMYVPDNKVSISSVTSNDILQYSDITSLKNIKNYTTTTIATLEENLWILNGAFINPTVGRKYPGYISNSISDDNGNFETNPTIDVELSIPRDIEYFSLILNPSVKSGYPKNIIINCLDINGNILNTINKNIIEETSLPNIIFKVNTPNVAKLQIEFVGTFFAHRRIRVASIMFGKVITLNQDEVLTSDYLDRCSFVPDSIPSRTFSFSVENYNKKYNIDNPRNDYINLDRQTVVLMRNGYNIYGYKEETLSDGTTRATISNPDKIKEIEWDDWKEFRLLNVSTDNNDTCTFECGSILDMMTDTYTKEAFINNRTVRFIVAELLNFMTLGTDIVVFSSDDDGKSYGDYVINTVLPELPVRELIQLLAFSVGATLLIKDDGTIKFANLNLNVPSSFTNHHKLTYQDFESVPYAEQLETTTKISLPKYNSIISSKETEIATFEVSSYEVDISYGECKPSGANVVDGDVSGGSVQSALLNTRRGTLIMNLPQANTSTKVRIMGYKIETNETQDRSVTNDTLIINTQLMSNDPGNKIKAKYVNWYNKKFKYVMNTRGEPLVDAGDYAEIETPFSGEESLLKTFVLQNHVTFNGSWSGDMEVIAL